ncbi:kelch domain-containing protein 4 [Selaginella moellendorffii]|uniref:kelch domain-containing protein 4 n=1 Tax=Selaginella moellendorffii TaxID=88036 RepID=UPI000D1CF32C|nr:kelch domain-containing protein 4 [Selaginella moellendorffii]|eukprot:XP_024518723.1 kelch domain-containing protein 4 [Selaginella moellendorffii]
MGKKKEKKPGKGKEKTERKTAKAAEKRARRDDKKVSDEDDIDAILAKIQKEEAKKSDVHVDENVAAPSPRSNCSVTVNPVKDTELIVYGGEFYNGDKTYVYGNLYRYNIEKNEWKLVTSPNSPPPRSAHQAVAWKNWLFIFGGEFTSPNQERFHHYKDLWRLDLNTNVWEQLQLKGSPGARSGHRLVLYKHKLILFGGFYDTLREVRYFNDLYVLDLDDYKWQEIKPKLGAAWPSARSGFQFAVYLDEIFLYGGYFKEPAPDKDQSDKGVVLADMWTLDPRNWEWDKVKKSGMAPGPRAGFSMCVHKKRAILFGGVVDTDDKGDSLHSVFMNEMYAFQMDNRRWYPLELRKPKSLKNKKKVVNPNVDNTSVEGEGVESQMEATTLEDEPTTEFQVVKPCGRIHAGMVVGKDTLFLYGGMKEVGEKEVTLDDLFSLDLNKLDAWKCIIEETQSEWIEVSDEEGESDDDNSDAGSISNGTDDEEDDGEVDAAESSQRVEEAAAILRGEGKRLTRKARKLKIDQMRSELGLADSQRTPLPGETLRDFFSRTIMYWQMAAYDHTQHTGKELRKDGFDLAETRYRELKPVLDELARLEADQKAEEEEEATKPSKKRSNK